MLTLRQQSGVMLLEALIGVLLFSVGLIAMMGLQANALATVNETKFRGEAAFIAEQFISDMRNDAAYANTIELPPPPAPPDLPVTHPETGGKVYPTTTTNGISPYTLTASTYPSTKTTVTPTAPADNAIYTTKMTYLAQKTAYTINRFYFATQALPGGSNYKPLVTVTPCVRTGWTTASVCPGPTNGLLGTELYGAVVEIELKWKLPTASPTADPRKYNTVAYIMLERTP